MSTATAYPYAVAPPRGPVSGLHEIQICSECGTPVRGVHEPKLDKHHLVVQCNNPDCSQCGFLPFAFGTRVVLARVGYFVEDPEQ